ncbi:MULTISPECIES: hypothetical protein [unclassified Pseudonocardia]|uniref:hypothetical protein n=1 Tax=unclassified Pseudonocardia TaxID=2619320 RepID=UPI001AC03C81|nr:MULTISPECIES: hypothetical protein [unclassified Pseudonocardia]MBN9098409.1 hypothetical protein [Pseudonocardia sp.]
MYGKLGSTAFLATPAGALACTGLDALWYVVAGFTLVAAGFAVGRLLPRRRK